MRKGLYCLLPNVKRFTDGKRIKEATGKMLTLTKSIQGETLAKFKLIGVLPLTSTKLSFHIDTTDKRTKLAKLTICTFSSLFCLLTIQCQTISLFTQ